MESAVPEVAPSSTQHVTSNGKSVVEAASTVLSHTLTRRSISPVAQAAVPSDPATTAGTSAESLLLESARAGMTL